MYAIRSYYDLLMEQLHEMGIDLLIITNEPMQSQEALSLVEPKMVFEPIEVVVSKKEVAIVRGQKGLPVFDLSKESIVPHSGRITSYNVCYTKLLRASSTACRR